MRYICFFITSLALVVQCINCNQINPSAIARNPIPTKKSSAAINGIKNSIASGMAAGCAKTILAPFDTIKTVQQQATSGGKALGLMEAARAVMSRPKGFLELYVSTEEDEDRDCVFSCHLIS
jgi:hypothetical protein